MSAIQTSSPIKTQTVNSFSLSLEGFEQVLRAEQPIQQIEAQILTQLENPVRLLRWAIVKVEPQKVEPQKVETQQQEPQKYWCEGAYLKSCQ